MKYVLFVQLLPSIKKNEPSAAGIGYATEPEAEPNVRRGKDMSRVPHGTRLSYGIFFLCRPCLFLRSVLQIRPCTVPEKIANEPELDGLQLLPEKNILVVV